MTDDIVLPTLVPTARLGAPTPLALGWKGGGNLGVVCLGVSSEVASRPEPFPADCAGGRLEVHVPLVLSTASVSKQTHEACGRKNLPKLLFGVKILVATWAGEDMRGWRETWRHRTRCGQLDPGWEGWLVWYRGRKQWPC